MSAHVLLNVLNELGEKIRCEASYRFPSMSLINSIVQQHECKILFYYMKLKTHLMCDFHIKTSIFCLKQMQCFIGRQRLTLSSNLHI